MNKAAKTYLVQFGSSMAVYMVVLFSSIALLKNLDGSPWRIPVALLPVIPIFFALMAFLRFFGAMDELQKRIQFDALALSFVATGLLTFSYGLLENAGLPKISYVMVFPLMIALWGIGSIIATRRYQ